MAIRNPQYAFDKNYYTGEWINPIVGDVKTAPEYVSGEWYDRTKGTRINEARVSYDKAQAVRFSSRKQAAEDFDHEFSEAETRGTQDISEYYERMNRLEPIAVYFDYTLYDKERDEFLEELQNDEDPDRYQYFLRNTDRRYVPREIMSVLSKKKQARLADAEIAREKDLDEFYPNRDKDKIEALKNQADQDMELRIKKKTDEANKALREKGLGYLLEFK